MPIFKEFIWEVKGGGSPFSFACSKTRLNTNICAVQINICVVQDKKNGHILSKKDKKSEPIETFFFFFGGGGGGGGGV